MIAPEDQLEDVDHGEEIQAFTNPIIEEEEDDDDFPRKVQKGSPRRKFDGPKFAELYPSVKGNLCAPSVEEKLRGMWGKWADYCKSSSFDGEPWVQLYGLQLFHNRSDIHNSGGFNHERVDGFFQWLSDNNSGKTDIKNAKTFLNVHLQAEHFCRLSETNEYAQAVTFKVGEMATVRSISKTVNARTAKEAMDNCADIQADLDQLLSASKVREILLSALRPKPGGIVSRLSPTNTLIFCCMYTGLSQTSRRGEELYGQKLVQRLTNDLGEIGPFGIRAAVIVTNKAKHNQEGWLEYTTMLPHMDPIRDTAAWHGLLLLWRLSISNEVFPQFAGNTDYESIFALYSYPSAKDPTVPVSPKQCGDVFKSFFLDNDAVCAKLVHQPRFQAIQEMDRSGIHETEWTRMSGHKGREAKVHTRSYAHNPPSKCLVQRGGGDPQDIRGFNPVHFLPKPNEQVWLDEIVQLLIPDIVVQYKQVCEEYIATKSHQERKAKRLTTIKGMLGGAKNDVEHLVMMMASPLVHPDTYMIDSNNTQSLWDIYHNDVFAGVLNGPAFQLEAFSLLQQSILGKLKAQHDFASSLSRESKCAMEAYIKDNVTRPLFISHQENRTVMAHIQQQQEIQNRNHQQLLQCIMNGGNTTRNFVTPDKAPAWPANGTPIRYQNQPTQNISPARTVTLAGTARKRKAEVTQRDAISQEYRRRELAGESVGEPIELLCDKGLITLDDYWAKYKSKWKPLEESTDGEWRKDLICEQDGKVKRGRSAWWTQRVGMFKVIEHLIDSVGLTESEALDKARTIFNSARDSPGKKPGIKKLNVAFKKEMEMLGIKAIGRPKKAPNNRNWRSQKKADTSHQFAMAFGNEALDESFLPCAQRVVLEDEENRRQMEERWQEYERVRERYTAIHPLPYHPARHHFDPMTAGPLPIGCRYVELS